MKSKQYTNRMDAVAKNAASVISKWSTKAEGGRLEKASQYLSKHLSKSITLLGKTVVTADKYSHVVKHSFPSKESFSLSLKAIGKNSDQVYVNLCDFLIAIHEKDYDFMVESASKFKSNSNNLVKVIRETGDRLNEKDELSKYYYDLADKIENHSKTIYHDLTIARIGIRKIEKNTLEESVTTAASLLRFADKLLAWEEGQVTARRIIAQDRLDERKRALKTYQEKYELFRDKDREQPAASKGKTSKDEPVAA